MKISRNTARLKPSATMAVSARARELKAKGRNILNLSVGEPDFPTPEHICAAAREAADAGFTHYTPVPGIPELLDAAAGYLNRFYDAGASRENIITGNGGKHCIYNIFACLLDPGDEVLVPAPYWVSYPPMVELTGAKAVVVAAPAEKNFKVDPDMLEAHLSPRTRMLILNSPSNPTGVCSTREELDALASWAVDKKLIVLSDEIYDRLTYGGLQAQSLCSWWKRFPEHFVIVNGVSKTFAMTGWRVGYTLAAPELIKAINRLMGQSTSNVCSIAQKAAVAALNGDYSFVESMRAAFERRRDITLRAVSGWPDVFCPEPHGGIYCFPDVHRHYGAAFSDSVSFCSYLLDEAGVAVVPGAAFGDDRCVRISYAVSDDILSEALEKIGGVLARNAVSR
ncbi:MAG: pyridoxal phosphate-dependent aminotransferase [Desulfovibrio sp.]|jgi:aspartate aminotransferase|nr:pyridoxal phosphate-dependent aminotransferase [Desulfovibrio sp.]